LIAAFISSCLFNTIKSQTIGLKTAEEFYALFEEELKQPDPILVNAYKYISSAYVLDSTNLKYINTMGEFLGIVNEFDEAIAVMDRSIEVDPNQWIPYNAKGTIYKNKRQYSSAIVQYTYALKWAKEDSIKVAVLVNRSSSKVRIQDFQSAFLDLKQAYTLDTMNKDLFLGLGNIYGHLGKMDSAMIFYNKSLSLDSTFGLAWLNVGFQLQSKGLYKESLTYFNRALVLDPTNGLSYSNRSFSLFKVGDYTGAMKDINKSIQLLPTNSWAYKNRAIYLLSKGEKNKACIDLNKAILEGYTRSYGDEVNNLLDKHCK